MPGKPAARKGDMTKYGGPIIQGSATVFIGDVGGVACAACAAAEAEGNPVNPLLGAKVLPDETDVFLPGPLPFALSRSYSSYQTDTPAPVGVLGPGWWLPLEASIFQSNQELLLSDTEGRTIHFEPLAPGEMVYSRSERLWIVRGGLDRLDDEDSLSPQPASPLALAWQEASSPNTAPTPLSSLPPTVRSALGGSSARIKANKKTAPSKASAYPSKA